VIDRPTTPASVSRPSIVGALRRRWSLVLVGVLVGALGAAGYLLVREPEYRATASVLVTPVQTGDPAAAINEQNGRDAVNLDTEAQLVTSTATLQRAREILGSTASLDELGAAVTTNVPPNTAVLEVSFVGPTAAAARNGAQAFADAYLDVRASVAKERVNAGIAAVQQQFDDLRQQLDAATTRVQEAPDGSAEQSIAQAEVSVLTSQLSTLTQTLANLRSNPVTPGRIIVDADLPSKADGPTPAVLLGGGVLLGLLLGVGLALMRERTDRHVRGPADVEQLVGVPSISLPLGRRAAPLRDIEPSSTAAGREFRRLRNELSSTLPRGRRVIIVTAASSLTDSSAVAANLAASLAQGGNDVTLVGADPEFPTLTAGGFEGPGLADVMAGAVDVKEVTHPVPGVPSLRYVSPGKDGNGLSTQVQSAAAAKLMETLQRATDFLVVHAPAASMSLDAQSLARSASAAVVVVEVGRTETDDLVDAVTQLQQVRLREVFCLLMAPQRRPDPSRAAGTEPGPATTAEDPPAATAVTEPSAPSEGSNPAAASQR
jgi:Mrp family chromosome partitioning ATPase